MSDRFSRMRTPSEKCFTFEFEKVRSKVKVKQGEKQRSTAHDDQEKVEQDTNLPLKIEVDATLQTQTPSIDEEIDIKFDAYTMTPGEGGDDDLNSETDLIPDWKLNKNVECRVTLIRMQNILSGKEIRRRMSSPHFKSGVIRSEDICISEFDKVGPKVMVELDKSGEEQEHTIHGRQEEQEQSEPNSVLEQEIEDHLQIETPFIDEDMDIKYEETGYERNWALNGENDIDLDPDDESSGMNLKDEKSDPDAENSEQIDLDQFYAYLHQCERNCKICQKYIRKLMKHVLCTHTTTQPASGPVLFVLMESGQFSFVERKLEEDKDIENRNGSEEIESDPDCEIEGESDPDYGPSPCLSRNALRQGVVKDHGSTDLKISREGNSKLRTNTGGKQFTGKTCSESFVRKHGPREHGSIHNGGKTPELNKRKIENRKTDSSKSNFSAFSISTLKTNLDASNQLCTVEKRLSDLEIKTGWNMKPYKSKDFNNSRSKSTTHKQPSLSSKRRFKCSECRKRFKKQSLLTIHMRSHTGSKLLNSNESGWSSSQKVISRSNMRGHNGNKPFKCETCDKNFGRQDALTVHMKIHTGVKPFKCGMCNKNFGTQGALTLHMRVHTGDKPFKCVVCNKNFGRKDNLTLHMRVHTGDKLFKCMVCNQNFGRKDNLTLHMRVHTGDKPFKCGECKKKFGRQYALTRHMRIHAGD